MAGRIAEAAWKPCIALVRELEAEARLQMCDADELRAVVPEHVVSMLEGAIRAVIPDGQTLARAPISAATGSSSMMSP